MVTKKKMGAPPKPPTERRTYRLVTLLNQAEREAVETATSRLGVEASSWVREVVLRAAERVLAKASAP